LTFTVAPAANTTYSWTSESGTENGTPTGDDNSTYTVSGSVFGTKQVRAAASVTYNVGAKGPKTCASTFSDVASAIVNPLPVVTPADVFTYCGSGTFPLSVTVATGESDVTSAATIKWYSNNDTGSTQLETGANYTTETLTASATYYVGAVVNATSCPSASLTPVTATVNLYEGVIDGAED
jgi:hypothetical protein